MATARVGRLRHLGAGAGYGTHAREEKRQEHDRSARRVEAHHESQGSRRWPARSRQASVRRPPSATRRLDPRRRPLAHDGWEVNGCPVNGPAVAAAGPQVAAAWFTAANETSRVNVAFSADSGATFGPPIVVDDGRPLGRVDVVLLDQGRALVSWLEQSANGAELRPLERLPADDPLGARGCPGLARRLGFSESADCRPDMDRVPLTRATNSAPFREPRVATWEPGERQASAGAVPC
jgi:hypothetical protein